MARSERNREFTNRMWFSAVCTLIDNDARHHSGQNVMYSQGAAESTTNFDHVAMMRIVVRTSIDHAKLYFNLFFFHHNIDVKENAFIFELELKKGIW